MSSCTTCGKPLDCQCILQNPAEHSVIACPHAKKPGAIWVHVTDDSGRNIQSVTVNSGFAATNTMGLTIREPLAAGPYEVELPPSSDLSKKYDFPAIVKKQVTVRDGTIAYVPFLLTRKAHLQVEFVFRSDEKQRFENSVVKVDVARSSSPALITPYPPIAPFKEAEKGFADVGLVSVGKYVLTPDYSGLVDRDHFDLDHDAQTVELSPDEVRTATFRVERRAQLKVEIVYKRCPGSKLPKTYLEDAKVTITALREGANAPLTGETNKGVADFGWVTAGKYTITPDYSTLEQCQYDWKAETKDVELKPSDAETVEFEVEPLYQKVQFIAHCLLTIPDQIFEPSPEDAGKLDVTTQSDGTRKFSLKSRDVQVGLFTKSDLVPAVPYPRAELKTNSEGVGTLTFKPKDKQKTDFWRLTDLDPATLNPGKIEVGAKVGNNPDIYEVKFKPRFSKEQYTPQMLTGKWRGKYHGHVNDKEDIAARLKFIKDTLSRAYAKAEKDPKVLKVFMIPECFFQGLYGAYLTDDASYLQEELQKLVADENWKDWVFSFGTVNSVFEGLPPQGVTYTRSIFEMRNHAPVIRGGLCGENSSGPLSTRMIQKLVNSAELADDLIEEKNAVRKQAVNADVQFMGTENDEKVGNLLAELLRDEKSDGTPGKLFLSKGLPKEWWSASTVSFHGLKEELEETLGTWGMARVSREIRISANGAVNNLPLKDWAYCSNESGSINRKTFLPDLNQAALLLIKTVWEQQKPEAPFMNTEWAAESNKDKRNAVLEKILNNLNGVANDSGFRLSYQQDAIRTKIKELSNNDDLAKNFVPDKLGNLSFRPSIFPLWRKLLELYAEEKKADVPLNLSKESLNLEDYCFAGPRKAGPWFGSLGEARPLQPCKRLVFGLEICADHADNRLSAINTGSNSIEIDIQLVPSAGMRPAYFAARQGGFIFNCDGWNKVPPSGGKSIEIHLDGPSPFTYINEEGYDVDVSPVAPHSVAGKRVAASTGSTAGSWFTPTTEALDPDLSKLIFGKGPGELHIYPVQDLPK